MATVWLALFQTWPWAPYSVERQQWAYDHPLSFLAVSNDLHLNLQSPSRLLSPPHHADTLLVLIIVDVSLLCIASRMWFDSKPYIKIRFVFKVCTWRSSRIYPLTFHQFAYYCKFWTYEVVSSCIKFIDPSSSVFFTRSCQWFSRITYFMSLDTREPLVESARDWTWDYWHAKLVSYRWAI